MRLEHHLVGGYVRYISPHIIIIINQINASFIDILRIKWLVFLLRSSFFRTTSTVASSEAPAE